jgi:iron complex transport system substrate-binding protein
VMFILSHNGSPQVSGEGTAADALIKLAGGVNVMRGFKGYKPLTTEAAVAALPDVILITTQGLKAIGGVDGLLAQPGMALTPAAKTKHVVDMEALYMLGFGPRLPQALREMAQRIRSAFQRPVASLSASTNVPSRLSTFSPTTAKSER